MIVPGNHTEDVLAVAIKTLKLLTQRVTENSQSCIENEHINVSIGVKRVRKKTMQFDAFQPKCNFELHLGAHET